MMHSNNTWWDVVHPILWGEISYRIVGMRMTMVYFLNSNLTYSWPHPPSIRVGYCYISTFEFMHKLWTMSNRQIWCTVDRRTTQMWWLVNIKYNHWNLWLFVMLFWLFSFDGFALTSPHLPIIFGSLMIFNESEVNHNHMTQVYVYG